MPIIQAVFLGDNLSSFSHFLGFIFFLLAIFLLGNLLLSSLLTVRICLFLLTLTIKVFLLRRTTGLKVKSKMVGKFVGLVVATDRCPMCCDVVGEAGGEEPHLPDHPLQRALRLLQPRSQQQDLNILCTAQNNISSSFLGLNRAACEIKETSE